jgi:hypothetical protein
MAGIWHNIGIEWAWVGQAMSGGGGGGQRQTQGLGPMHVVYTVQGMKFISRPVYLLQGVRAPTEWM